MIWCRSWPTDAEVASRRVDRPHVIDGMPRLLMSNFDYLTVTEWPPQSFAMLEWDVALDRRNRQRFAWHARAEPGRVIVAPYMYGNYTLPDVPDGAGEADTFGFGCIYFPQDVLAAALNAFRDSGTRLTDSSFCRWHRQIYPPARVVWDVHPQHLREPRGG